MSTLPTRAETSWLFSSPGSVLAIAIWRKPRRHQLDHAEFRDVAVRIRRGAWTAQGDIRPLSRRRGDAVFVLQKIGHAVGIEQAERRFENRADLVADLERVDRPHLHQLLEALGERRFAAADRAEQIEDLLALLEPLRCVAEIADDALDRVLHAVELGEGRVNLDGPVGEDAAEPLVLRWCRSVWARRSRPPSAPERWHTSICLRGRQEDTAGGSPPPAPRGCKSPKTDRRHRCLCRPW